MNLTGHTTNRTMQDATLRQAWERLYLVLGGHIYFQTLSAAVRLDLFTLLSKRGPLTRAEIAAALDIAEKPARILLLGCTALGLLHKEGDKSSNAHWPRSSSCAMLPATSRPSSSGSISSTTTRCSISMTRFVRTRMSAWRNSTVPRTLSTVG